MEIQSKWYMEDEITICFYVNDGVDILIDNVDVVDLKMYYIAYRYKHPSTMLIDREMGFNEICDWYLDKCIERFKEYVKNKQD